MIDAKSILVTDPLTGRKLWKDKDDKIHRTDGPAIEHPNGTVAWYIHGFKWDLDDYCELVGATDEQKLQWILQYG